MEQTGGGQRMFCINCGKEIGDGIKFCPHCGAPVSTAADIDRGQGENVAPAQPGLGGTGDYEALRQMSEKAGKSKKTLNTIATVLTAAYAFIVVRGLLMNLVSVVEGKTDTADYVLMVVVAVLFTCIILHIVLAVAFPILQGKKAVRAEEYLKCIRVDDRRALMHALGQMKCSTVRRVYMDERGEVCVVGRKRKHAFTIQDGTPVITSQKDDYKAVLERETIAVCLLKFLVPEAPVNAYANEKGNLRLAKMKKVLAITASVCGVLFVIIAISSGSGNSYVEMVKNGSPELYPNITYGAAFEAFFDNCEWEYFASEDGQDVVEFRGNCLYDNERVAVLVQFVVNKTAGSFEVWTAAIDGEEQPLLVYSGMLMSVFESYGGESRIGQLDALPDENNSSARMESEEPAVDTVDEDNLVQEYNDTDDFPMDDIVVDTISWEAVSGLSGLWSDGEVALSVSIYSDAEEYSMYSEIGTCSYGGILGALYFMGGDRTGLYVSCELPQGSEIMLKYWGMDEMEVWNVSEGMGIAEGATLYCEEHYVS